MLNYNKIAKIINPAKNGTRSCIYHHINKFEINTLTVKLTLMVSNWICYYIINFT